MRKGMPSLHYNGVYYDSVEEFFKNFKPKGIIRKGVVKRHYEVALTVKEPPMGVSVVNGETILFTRKARCLPNEIVAELKKAGDKGSIDIIVNFVGSSPLQTRYII